MRIKMSRKMQRAATVAGAALGASLLFTTQAFAWSGSWNGPGGGGAGDINFTSNTSANWDMTIIDTKSDGYCTRVKLIIDRPGWSDTVKYGTPVCGYQVGKNWKDSTSTTGGTKMRSIKIQQCRLHSDYSDETCQQVKQISNPKY